MEFTKNKKRILGLRPHVFKFWATLTGVLLVAFLYLFAGDGIWQTMIMKNKVAKLQGRIDSLVEVNERMRKHIAALKKGDSLAIEEEARSHGMIKQGEKVYIIKTKDESVK